MARIFALLVLVGACARTGATPSPSVGSEHSVPAKCTACHLAAREHSLVADRWARWEKSHRRRVRLTDRESSFLHGLLVKSEGPDAGARDGPP